MSAFFILDPIEKPRSEHQVYIGTSLEFETADVVEVQLDGHELEHVSANFTGIRMCKHKRVVTLYGEDARFVATNW